MQKTLQIVLVMFLWAICFPLITIGLPYAPHLTFAALRAFIAGATLVVIALLLRRALPKGLKTWFMLTMVGLGATTLGFFGMFHASEFVSPGIATVISNTQPILASLLAFFILGEYLNTRGKLGLLLGFLGVILIALPGLLSNSGSTYLAGISYILLSASGITISNVLIRYIATEIDALTAMGWQLILGSILLALIAIVTEDPATVQWSPEFLFSLLGLSLPGTALAYWLWCHVLRITELDRANVFSFLVPIFGLLLGMAFYGETYGFLVLEGIGLILLGIILVNWSQKDWSWVVRLLAGGK
ncbi:MAG: EamA family transporter [Ectothiorhodospiraceae bacterium]|nr:EamA family transporter [Ectothiorhodospiraceae bacterium]